MLKYKIIKLNSVGGDLPFVENKGNHLYLLTLVFIRDFLYCNNYE